MQKDIDRQCANLPELVKNIVLGFCKINVPYTRCLDIYGSMHIRADDQDTVSFMLNEHCYSSRASSPTITSAQPVDQESEGNDAGLTGDQGSCNKQQKYSVKKENSAETTENQCGTADWSAWPDVESATVQHQPLSCANDQPVGDTLNDTGTVSEDFTFSAASGAEGRIKRELMDSEAAEEDDSSSGSVEILDDDPTDYDYDPNSEMKPEFFRSEEDYEAEMPFGYDGFAKYDESVDQYSNIATNTYPHSESYMGNTANRCKPGAASVQKTCAYCQERFGSDAELFAHFKQYHQCARPPVRRMRKTFSRQVDQTPNSIVNVSADANVIQMFKCRFCDQLFRSRDGLANHENVKHSRNKRYQCNFCSEEFLTRQAAYTHRVKFHRLLSRRMQ